MLTWKHSFAVFAPRFIAFVNAAVYLQRSQTSVLFFLSLISSRSPVLISRFNSSIFWAPRLPAVTTLIIDPLQKEGQIKKEKSVKPSRLLGRDFRKASYSFSARITCGVPQNAQAGCVLWRRGLICDESVTSSDYYRRMTYPKVLRICRHA